MDRVLGIEKLQRGSKQRTEILEELRRLDTHPTASTLYEIVREKMPRISLGTVYRNLEILANQGIIIKINTTKGKSQYDGNILEHDHVRCRECGKLGDVYGISPTLAKEKTNRHMNGWEIHNYRLEYNGICPDCKLDMQDPEDSQLN